MHRSECVESMFRNLFFITLMVLNIHSSLSKPNSWTTTISTNLMYSESSWLRTTNTLSFHQSLVLGLNQLSFCIIAFKLCSIVILQKKIANQRMTLKHDKRIFPIFTNNLVNCMNVAFNKTLGECEYFVMLPFHLQPIIVDTPHPSFSLPNVQGSTIEAFQ